MNDRWRGGFNWGGIASMRSAARQWLRTALASPALLFMVCLAIYWNGNGAIPLWDRDEPRFATAAREMLVRGDWIVPTFNGELRPDKPVLIYWLMGSAYSIFGVGTFAARAVSGLAAATACVIVCLLGRSMFNRSIGLLAGWILALSPMAIIEAKLATVDATLLLLNVGCFWCAWRVYQRSDRLSSALGFWAFLGLAILCKGPITVAIVGLSLFVFCLLRREFAWLRFLRWPVGLTMLAVIVAPWCFAVQMATEGDFLSLALGHHVLRRASEPLEGHRGFPGFYVLTLFGLMAPWAWLLPWSFRQQFRRTLGDPRLTFLACWAVAPLIMLEVVRTKLVHYYLPAYPALALWLAAALLGRCDGHWLLRRRWDRRIGFVWTAASAALGLGAVTVAWLALPRAIALPATVTTVILAGGAVIAGLLLFQLRFRRALVVQAATIVAGVLVAGAQLGPTIGSQRLIVQVAERIRSLPPGTTVALWSYRDPSLIFNIGRPVPVVDHLREQVPFRDSRMLARRQNGFLCPMTDEERERMAQDPALRLRTVESIVGWDIDRFRQRRVHLVEVTAATATADAPPPGLVEPYTIPIAPESEEEIRNAHRRYPLNPVFLVDRPKPWW